MWDVGCGMCDVGCEMFDVGNGIGMILREKLLVVDKVSAGRFSCLILNHDSLANLQD